MSLSVICWMWNLKERKTKYLRTCVCNPLAKTTSDFYLPKLRQTNDIVMCQSVPICGSYVNEISTADNGDIPHDVLCIYVQYYATSSEIIYLFWTWKEAWNCWGYDSTWIKRFNNLNNLVYELLFNGEEPLTHARKWLWNIDNYEQNCATTCVPPNLRNKLCK